MSSHRQANELRGGELVWRAEANELRGGELRGGELVWRAEANELRGGELVWRADRSK